MLKLLPENLASITAHVRALGWIPQQGTLANPRPAGEGNMNRTLRFDCEHCGDMTSVVLKQAVPFVAKYPDIPAPIERGAAEAAFYQAAQNHASLEARLPRLLGTDKANHLLAFEDLGQAADLSAAYSDQELKRKLSDFIQPLMVWLGDLHAITPPTLDNHCMRELNHTHIFELPLQPDNGLDLGALTDTARSCANDQPLKLAAARLGNIYTGNASYASTPALLHGDFYPGSWLGTLGDAANVKVIDPEFAFVGPAEFDVGVCIAHLLFAGMTLQQALDSIHHYQRPAGFSQPLAEGFAGIELLRRLLGVAQLPLPETLPTQTKLGWIETGRTLVLASADA